MREKLTAAVVGVVLFAASMWLLADLADLVSVSALARIEVLAMLFPTSLAIGFALLVWLYW
ncbi:hypothetical protein [Halobellus marinus]|jgi:hypothetical protein|uniref:hypothetical protein n=1 Tax=Halobellus TaxID=1073986 RepID=UPI0028AE45EB|nr:hypothetical protein [Halobellus sp. DFY28]